MSEEKKIPAFVIDHADTIKWPVSVSLPVDGGKVEVFLFTGEFKRMSESELDNLLGVGDQGAANVNVDRIGEPNPEPKSVAQALKENAGLIPQIMVGWEGVKTAKGKDVPFSVETLQSQITGPNGAFLSAALWTAIRQIRMGEARLGN